VKIHHHPAPAGVRLKEFHSMCLLSQITMKLLTYLLTPWSRAVLEKLTGSQLVKKLSTFYGT
jgi:hypothetical protein